MRLTKLSLSGFKSFVEPTEFQVEKGLTGIVGPNGCGKSNLVEALRWVMGETSAKQMRGDGMDDVIFNGTSTRPARNLANVTLKLNNSDRKAPAQFNDSDEIEITRHIERGQGSTYTLNGLEVRARDIQLLFADFATGAHSSALVGQGQVNNLINEKPSKRRKLLEEASGITGLHARRHEAELRLRGAETNLERLQDVIHTLDIQLNALKRQTRQATRYRKISDNLKKWEAKLLYVRWLQAKQFEVSIEERIKIASSDVQKCSENTAIATNERESYATKIPPLRIIESECATTLQRLTIEHEQLDDEERQVNTLRNSIAQNLIQINSDIEREQALSKDAEEAIILLTEEYDELFQISELDYNTESKAKSKQDSLRDEVNKLESEISILLESVISTEARQNDFQLRKDELNSREIRLRDEHKNITEETQINEDDEEKNIQLTQAEQNIHTANQDYVKATIEAEETKSQLKIAQNEERQAKDTLQLLETKGERLHAEANAIKGLLGQDTDDSFQSIVDNIEVDSGYENALGVALGDDLQAPADKNAPIHWAIPSQKLVLSDLPHGIEPLSKFVVAPNELSKRLSQIGVINEHEGSDLRNSLLLGQRLVSREGSLWRWDGYTVKAGASTPAASRLKQRNRLSELSKEIKESDSECEEARSLFKLAEQKVQKATHDMETSLETATKAGHYLNKARDLKSTLSEEAATRLTRKEALAENFVRVENELAETLSEKIKLEEEMAELSVNVSRRQSLEIKRAELDQLRLDLEKETRIYENTVRELSNRKERLVKILSETTVHKQQAGLAVQRLSELGKRKIIAEQDKEELENKPQTIAAKRKLLFDQIANSETERNEAADNLAQAESILESAERELKEKEANLVSARELFIREEGIHDQSKQATDMAKNQIRERLGCSPKDIVNNYGINDDNIPEDADEIEIKIQRLTKERENIGPVNLRAESEANEIETQIETMKTEQKDLEAAISRLRQGISDLNREGRERIIGSFTKIDEHFQSLFTKLFGGGHAHLEMVGSEDPLEAGLEIMASPPGKRLQTLSLLSGGEKALTATALIFAAFLTNPAPICVLDEVDAPLDDTNVGRFCSLISDLVDSTDTKFIIITHHRMTMTKVDRLYGITMEEKGVSQLVSVDLTEAEQWRKTV
ncbi:MAG: chromosome segregation protein SMC [Rhodospirillaceae bacterium]|nr:chromosome segregation protein SMC [Rhodospirillaceae bacterium]